MKAIIYISKSIYDFNSEALLTLSNNAESYNATIGVTGYLWYEKGMFLQYIEGDDQPLEALMLKIESDSRHTILHQLATTCISKARFPNWNMRCFQANPLIEITLEKVLTNQLLFLKSVSISDPRLMDNVWQITNSLAKHNQ